MFDDNDPFKVKIATACVPLRRIKTTMMRSKFGKFIKMWFY